MLGYALLRSALLAFSLAIRIPNIASKAVPNLHFVSEINGTFYPFLLWEKFRLAETYWQINAIPDDPQGGFLLCCVAFNIIYCSLTEMRPNSRRHVAGHLSLCMLATSHMRWRILARMDVGSSPNSNDISADEDITGLYITDISIGEAVCRSEPSRALVG